MTVGKWDAEGNPVPTWTGFKFGQPCPSMDDKYSACPPIQTTEEYEWNLAQGFLRGGYPIYGSKGNKPIAE